MALVEAWFAQAAGGINLYDRTDGPAWQWRQVLWEAAPNPCGQRNAIWHFWISEGTLERANKTMDLFYEHFRGGYYPAVIRYDTLADAQAVVCP